MAVVVKLTTGEYVHPDWLKGRADDSADFPIDSDS